MLRLAKLQQTVRDLTHMVADGDLPGLFVVGGGGLGKSHAVLEALAERAVEPRTFNTRAADFSLYAALYEAKDEQVVLLEDLEELFSDTGSLQLLRSLLWGKRSEDGSMERVATWTSRAVDGVTLPKSFQLNAGILCTANRFPRNNPVFDSLRTRVPTVRFEVEPEDVHAFMRELVREGYVVFDGKRQDGARIAEEDCLVVLEHLKARGATDLRMLIHSLTLFHRHRETGRWKELLDVILAGASVACGDASPRAGARGNGAPRSEAWASGGQARARELRVVAELLAREELSSAERVALFQKRTGKSRESFFRRQREVRSSGGPTS